MTPFTPTIPTIQFVRVVHTGPEPGLRCSSLKQRACRALPPPSSQSRCRSHPGIGVHRIWSVITSLLSVPKNDNRAIFSVLEGEKMRRRVAFSPTHALLLCVLGQACAEHLVSGGFTTPSLMGAQVNSAGGLLAGVMANQRPGLFSAMVMKVC